MGKFSPKTLPKAHREFLDHAIRKLSEESWLIGIAASGSYTSDTMDAFSDLDLVLAVEEKAHSAVMENRLAVARWIGPLLSAFFGRARRRAAIVHLPVRPSVASCRFHL